MGQMKSRLLFGIPRNAIRYVALVGRLVPVETIGTSLALIQALIATLELRTGELLGPRFSPPGL